MADAHPPVDPVCPPTKQLPVGSRSEAVTLFRDQTPTGDAVTPTLGEFAGYDLLAELGRGGMGVVFKARQKSLDRIVAIKTVLSMTSSDDLQRFRLEAESAARLQHPNIVAIHEVGQWNGQHYYTMDLIDGPSLAHLVAEGPLAGKVAARYVQVAARAIHHAHGVGVLHRDLKPSNILLDRADEPHITDFGLAKRLGTDSSHTRTGAILGTPSYMAPEQAAGKNREIGPACDVYGLGAVLYELLTGRPPFRSETPLDTIMHVLERDPAPPRLLNPKIDRDLEIICLKCLEKDPARRYASAQALADDLERYLNGESISVRGFNVLDRLARTLQRSRHDVEFRTWGDMLFWVGGIVLVAHLVIFWLTLRESPVPYHLVFPVRLLQLLGMGLVFWIYRRGRLLPSSPAERELYSIWIGYLVACFAFGFAARLYAWSTGRIHDELALFPAWTTMAGMCFFMMGSNYWGKFYALAVVFFAMTFFLSWQPWLGALGYGGLWTVCFLVVGWRLRRLGAEAGK